MTNCVTLVKAQSTALRCSVSLYCWGGTCRVSSQTEAPAGLQAEVSIVLLNVVVSWDYPSPSAAWLLGRVYLLAASSHSLDYPSSSSSPPPSFSFLSTTKPLSHTLHPLPHSHPPQSQKRNCWLTFCERRIKPACSFSPNADDRSQLSFLGRETKHRLLPSSQVRDESEAGLWSANAAGRHCGLLGNQGWTKLKASGAPPPPPDNTAWRKVLEQQSNWSFSFLSRFYVKHQESSFTTLYSIVGAGSAGNGPAGSNPLKAFRGRREWRVIGCNNNFRNPETGKPYLVHLVP